MPFVVNCAKRTQKKCAEATHDLFPAIFSLHVFTFFSSISCFDHLRKLQASAVPVEIITMIKQRPSPLCIGKKKIALNLYIGEAHLNLINVLQTFPSLCVFFYFLVCIHFSRHILFHISQYLILFNLQCK